MEKKLKELLLQVEDERRNADQFKNEVGFGLHLKCNKLVQTSSKPRDDLHLILRGNFSNGDDLIMHFKKKKKSTINLNSMSVLLPLSSLSEI